MSFADGCVALLGSAINTLVVLLADKGVAACNASISTFAQLQRLFMALCRDVSGVQTLVDSRCTRFMQGARSKSDMPSLGDFIPLLLVTKAVSWPQVRGPLVREVLARNVLWACRHNSALAKLDGQVSTTDRLRDTWDGTKVSAQCPLLRS